MAEIGAGKLVNLMRLSDKGKKTREPMYNVNHTKEACRRLDTPIEDMGDWKRCNWPN